MTYIFTDVKVSIISFSVNMDDTKNNNNNKNNNKKLSELTKTLQGILDAKDDVREKIRSNDVTQSAEKEQHSSESSQPTPQDASKNEG